MRSRCCSAAAATVTSPTTSSKPPFHHAKLVEKILAQLDAAPDGLTLGELQIRLNAPRGRLDHALNCFRSNRQRRCSSWTIVGSAPPRHVAPAFWERVERLTELRKREQTGCSNTSRRVPASCNFSPANWTNTTRRRADVALSVAANHCLPNNFLRRSPNAPRNFSNAPIIPSSPASSGQRRIQHLPVTGKVSESLRAESGRVLAIWGDAGWGELVRAGKYSITARFDDRLVTAVVEMIRKWNPQPQPAWVTCVRR